MSGKKREHRAPSATPWDGADESTLSPSELLVAAAHRSMCGFGHEPFEGDAGFFNAYARDARPLCGDAHVVRSGTGRDGAQKYACRSCGGYFTPATGAIFDNAKLPATAWADFIPQAVSYESVAAMTREDGRAETTPPYWMAKLSAVLEGIQDETVLSGAMWLDETCRCIR